MVLRRVVFKNNHIKYFLLFRRAGTARSKACGEPVRPKRQGSMKQEAPTSMSCMNK